jgi:hypothetical protein
LGAQVLALWALYLDGATLVLGTAQNLDIAEECWQGSVDIAEGVPDLAAEIADVNRTNGKKALVLTGGERYKVQAANRRGGRSLTVKLAILDELREHQTWDAWGAITKTTMAQRDGLVVALTNAGDDKSVVLNDQQERATSRVDDPETTIAIFEWSGAPGCDINDPQAQAQANPSVGYTDLTIEAIRAAAESDPEPIYRTEVLCQHVAQIVPSALPVADWANLADEASEVQDGAYLVFGVASSWDQNGELIEERHCWYLPDLNLRQQIIAGWAQFERDLAAYVLPDEEAPKPVGRAPESLPALLVEVSGSVTASNLAEFKASALTLIRGVNRDLRSDQDFADAEKAVKWCADVESRLKAAKEHALSQTSSIDALFKAIDDISTEARTVRLDLDKLVAKRKQEIKEQAVSKAIGDLNQHVAALNAEIAPMRLPRRH